MPGRIIVPIHGIADPATLQASMQTLVAASAQAGLAAGAAYQQAFHAIASGVLPQELRGVVGAGAALGAGRAALAPTQLGGAPSVGGLIPSSAALVAAGYAAPGIGVGGGQAGLPLGVPVPPGQRDAAFANYRQQIAAQGAGQADFLRTETLTPDQVYRRAIAPIPGAYGSLPRVGTGTGQEEIFDVGRGYQRNIGVVDPEGYYRIYGRGAQARFQDPNTGLYTSTANARRIAQTRGFTGGNLPVPYDPNVLGYGPGVDLGLEDAARAAAVGDIIDDSDFGDGGSRGRGGLYGVPGRGRDRGRSSFVGGQEFFDDFSDVRLNDITSEERVLRDRLLRRGFESNEVAREVQNLRAYRALDPNYPDYRLLPQGTLFPPSPEGGAGGRTFGRTGYVPDGDRDQPVRGPVRRGGGAGPSVAAATAAAGRGGGGGGGYGGGGYGGGGGRRATRLQRFGDIALGTATFLPRSARNKALGIGFTSRFGGAVGIVGLGIGAGLGTGAFLGSRAYTGYTSSEGIEFGGVPEVTEAVAELSESFSQMASIIGQQLTPAVLQFLEYAESASGGLGEVFGGAVGLVTNEQGRISPLAFLRNQFVGLGSIATGFQLNDEVQSLAETIFGNRGRSGLTRRRGTGPGGPGTNLIGLSPEGFGPITTLGEDIEPREDIAEILARGGSYSDLPGFEGFVRSRGQSGIFGSTDFTTVSIGNRTFTVPGGGTTSFDEDAVSEALQEYGQYYTQDRLDSQNQRNRQLVNQDNFRRSQLVFQRQQQAVQFSARLSNERDFNTGNLRALRLQEIENRRQLVDLLADEAQLRRDLIINRASEALDNPIHQLNINEAIATLGLSQYTGATAQNRGSQADRDALRQIDTIGRGLSGLNDASLRALEAAATRHGFTDTGAYVTAFIERTTGFQTNSDTTSLFNLQIDAAYAGEASEDAGFARQELNLSRTRNDLLIDIKTTNDQINETLASLAAILSGQTRTERPEELEGVDAGIVSLLSSIFGGSPLAGNRALEFLNQGGFGALNFFDSYFDTGG